MLQGSIPVWVQKNCKRLEAVVLEAFFSSGGQRRIQIAIAAKQTKRSSCYPQPVSY